MDYDNDGILDLISGSYDPGDIYLFRGLGKGEYAAGESIKDSNGVPLVHHPVELARFEKSKEDPDADKEKATQDRVASFGSWPEVVDWDGDGDLDMLIGTFSGEVYLRLNEGTRAEPSFSPESVPIENDDGPLKMHGHAHPVVADWDKDGGWDLVLGSDVGKVVWFRNRGTAKAPEFGAEQVLIPAAAGQKFFEQVLSPGEPRRPGVRAQICVTDYNGDGWLDLIVGDYSDVKWTKELSEEEQAEKKKDEAQVKELSDKVKALGYEKEVMEERQKLMDQLFALEDEMNSKYFKEVRRSSFIWLYLRHPVDSKREKGDDDAANSSVESANESARSSAAKKQGPVEFITRLDRDPTDSGKCMLVIEAQIQDGWKLPAGTTEEQTGIPVSFELVLPDGWESKGDWKNPVGEPAERSRERYLKRRAIWKRSIQLPETASAADQLTVAIRFQVCDEQICLPPKSVKKTVSLK